MATPRAPPLLGLLLLAGPLLAEPGSGDTSPATGAAQAAGGLQFDEASSPNVTARVNGTAILSCRIRNVSPRQVVSWGRQYEVLTSGDVIFAIDGRFQPLHQAGSDEWGLRVRSVRPADAGWYFCQVSATPPVSHRVYLSVVDPKVEIEGAPKLFINKGSTINLTCIIRNAHKAPENVRWTYDNKLVQFDKTRKGVKVRTSYELHRTVSYFSIERALPSDSGEYFCDPDGLAQAKVMVRVLNGEHPAAMQTGGVGQAAAPALLLFSVTTNLYTACRLV